MTASPPTNSSLPASVPPAQNVEAICAELQKIAKAKWEIMDIDNRRKELISELNEFQMQDQFIKDTNKTIQELNEERDSHTEIIQQINQDKNSLEKIMSGAREEQKTLESKLSRSYEQIFQMLEQINRLSKESGLSVDELLDPNPSSFLPQLSTSIPNFHPSQQQLNNITSSALTTSTNLTPVTSTNSTSSANPMSNLTLGLPLLSSTAGAGSGPNTPHQLQFQQQQQFLNQLKMNSMFNMDPQTAALMNAIAAVSYPPVSTINGLQGMLSSGTAGSSSSAASNLLYPNVLAAAQNQRVSSTKLSGVDASHQSPPMKNCQSCNQEIHRNAPVCPYCRRRVSSQHSRRSKKSANKTKL